jgi:hypothetical protein
MIRFDLPTPQRYLRDPIENHFHNSSALPRELGLSTVLIGINSRE